MATDIGVRQTLRNKGIADTDIGFDQNTGYVTVKGQNFLKPEMNVQGTTYTSQQNFDNAYNQYNKQQRANQLQSATDSYITRATQPPAANPYNDQYTKMISDIMARVSAPQQNVYGTPKYAAAQAQADRSAKQGIRSAQEALGSSGFGRSTTLGQAANQAQNEANEYLQLQLVPQIQAQLANQRQSEINNMYNMLNPIYNQLTRQDTQNRNEQSDLMSVIELLTNNQQNDFNNDIARRSDARAEAGITGYYMPDGARDIINNILQLKQQAESQGVTPDQMANFKSQADSYRNRLYQMGIDPGMVGFDADFNQAMQNSTNYRGIPTLQGKGQEFNQQLATDQFQYGKEQDQIQNEAQYLGTYNGMPTMQRIIQEANLRNMTSDNVRAASAEARAAGNQQLGALFEVWDRTGAAPQGIPGVPAGTPLAGKSSSSSSKSELEADYISDIESVPAERRREALLSEKANIVADLGISGYNTLYNMYIDEDGDPK